MNEIQSAVETFEKYGIKTRVNKDNMIIISKYCQPKEKTFKELGIDEDELIKNVIACSGTFDTRKSALTTFPLEVANEIKLYEDTEISQMPNLRAVGKLFVNSKLKKLPKLKAVGSIMMENSSIKALPKLKEAGILIAQNSMLKDLASLENVGKLCIIDCPLEEMKSLKSAEDMFICSTDENNKVDLLALNKLEEVKKLFVANSTLKSMQQLKKADKIALYNCQIKSIKTTVCNDVEIETQIKDNELSAKFDTFTDWYNSEIFEKSMNLLGDVVNTIQG